MDARKLSFLDEYFDGVIFKRSLSLIGGGGAKKNERDITSALDNVHNILCGDGLVWIIYALADIENLTLDRMDFLLNSSSFKPVEDREDYRLYQKVKKFHPRFGKLLKIINL